MEAVYHGRTRTTWSWIYLLRTVFISTCLLQVILAPVVGTSEDGEEDTGVVSPNPSLNTNTSNSNIPSKSLSQLLFVNSNTTSVSATSTTVTPILEYSVTTNSSSRVYSSSTTIISESGEAPVLPTQTSSTTVTVPLPSPTVATTTAAAPHLITHPPGSYNNADLTTSELLSRNTSQTVPPQVEDTTSSLDMGGSDNNTRNMTSMSVPTSPFNLHNRVTLAIVAAFVAIVVIVVGKYACKKIEKRMAHTGDEEYANILEDAFSMSTEENVWDARWSTGRDQQHSQGATGEEADRKVVGEDSSLQSEHQRVTLHVPGSRPYGATESLMV